jgi:hypothetical protein
VKIRFYALAAFAITAMACSSAPSSSEDATSETSSTEQSLTGLTVCGSDPNFLYTADGNADGSARQLKKCPTGTMCVLPIYPGVDDSECSPASPFVSITARASDITTATYPTNIASEPWLPETISKTTKTSYSKGTLFFGGSKAPVSISRYVEIDDYKGGYAEAMARRNRKPAAASNDYQTTIARNDSISYCKIQPGTQMWSCTDLMSGKDETDLDGAVVSFDLEPDENAPFAPGASLNFPSAFWGVSSDNYFTRRLLGDVSPSSKAYSDKNPALVPVHEGDIQISCGKQLTTKYGTAPCPDGTFDKNHYLVRVDADWDCKEPSLYGGWRSAEETGSVHIVDARLCPAPKR